MHGMKVAMRDKIRDRMKNMMTYNSMLNLSMRLRIYLVGGFFENFKF